MKTKTKVILSALAVIAVCLCLTVGVTFALFTSSDEFAVEVTSGKVKVSAEPSAVKLYSLGEECEGEWASGGKAELKGGTLTLDRIAPGDSAEVTVKITNDSTVKIKYRLTVAVSGELAGVLETKTDGGAYTKYAIACGNWVYVSPKNGTDNTEESVVTIALPTDETEHGGESATVTVTVEATQANGNELSQRDIDAFKAAIDGEKNGAEVALSGGAYDLSGVALNASDIRIKGEDGTALNNAAFELADGGRIAFEDVAFGGKTSVHAKANGTLAFKNCTFDVAPDKLFGNSRASGIIGSHQNSTVDLILENCTFNYAASGDVYSAAVFMWSSVKNVSIKNCNFNGYGFVAVKLMNVAEGADILFEGNTFDMSSKGDANWFYNAAVQICPQHDRTFAVTFKDNVFTGDYETQNDAIENGNDSLVFAEVIGMNAGFPLTKATLTLENNTFNGETATADNVAYQSENSVIVIE